MLGKLDFIDRRLRVFAISGIVVILAGVRFFIQGKDDIGAGSIIVGAAVILLGFFLVKLHGSGVKRLKTEAFAWTRFLSPPKDRCSATEKPISDIMSGIIS